MVEDNPADARLVHEMLAEAAPHEFCLEHVKCLADAVARLGEGTYAAILVDLGLPGCSGIGSLEKLLEVRREIPIIVLSGETQEETAIAAVSSGAQDYLIKGRVTPDLLIRSIRYAVARKQSERDMLALADRAQAHKSQVDHILANIPGAVWEATGIPGTPEYRIHYISDYIETIIGYTPAEILADCNLWIDRVHPEDKERVWSEVRRAVAGDAVRAIECRSIRKDGRTAWIRLTPLIIRDETGAMVGTRGMVMDITDRKAAEEALRESEERLSLAVRAAGIGVWQTNYETGEVHWSDRQYEIFGLDPAIVPTPELVFSQIHPDDAPGVTAAIQAARENRTTYEREFRVVHPDGAVRWVDGLGGFQYNAEGMPTRVSGVAIDITARKAVEEQLRAKSAELQRANEDLQDSREKVALQTAMLRSILDSMGDGVAVSDLQGRLTMFNPEAERMLSGGIRGSTPEEWVGLYGLYLPDMVTPFPARELPLARALEGVSSDMVDIYMCLPGQQEGVWLSVTARPLQSPDGEITGGVAVFRDVSPLRAAEERLRQHNALLESRVERRTAELTEAVKELEAFSYSVSHDLRAPLRAIDGFTRIVEEEHSAALSEDARRCLAIVRFNTRQMAALVDDLLAFSRLGRQTITRTSIDMHELFRDAWAELQAAQDVAGVELTVGALGQTEGDPILIRQVFANLLSNALKYSRGRSPIRITVDSEPSPERPGETVYRVQDNGVGFDMRYAHKLFGVFQRLHRTDEFEGTGVGLAIVQRIVHRHHGRVWAHGEVDQGATFYFSLPAGGDE